MVVLGASCGWSRSTAHSRAYTEPFLLFLLAIACAHQVDVTPMAAAVALRPDAVQIVAAPIDTGPGARVLARAARRAQADGDLQQAFDLARDAYVAHPTRTALRYVESLERLLEATGGVASSL